MEQTVRGCSLYGRTDHFEHVMSGAEKKDGLWDVLNRSLYAARGLLTDQELVTRLFEESFRYAWDIGILLLELRIVSKGDEDYASSYQAQRRDQR